MEEAYGQEPLNEINYSIHGYKLQQIFSILFYLLYFSLLPLIL